MATVARVATAIVVVDLTTVSSILATTKVTLVAVEVVLVVARVLEQCLENFRIQFGHNHLECWKY